MRRRLLAVVLATSSLVVVAFAIPLALLVRTVAEDRAVSAAERDAAALAPVLAVTDDPDLIRSAVQRTETGADDRLGVWLPDGTVLGAEEDEDDAIALAREAQVSFTREVDGTIEVLSPVVLGDDVVAVIRARVPAALRRSGVTSAWLALAGVALVLIIGAALVADRLARSLTRDASELAATARALAGGDATIRAPTSPTPELSDAGRALNLLADRIDELLAAERERVADLSHRLRTPMTALRLDAEASGVAAVLDDVDRLESAVTALVHAARRPLHDAPVVAITDLAEIVRDRSEFWSALADEDGRAWSCRVVGERAPVRGEREEIVAVLDALIGNVHDHTPPGTAYEVALEVGQGRARLAVSDAGGGVADPGRALDRGVSGRGSTGLGLDIATRFAEGAGGTLQLGDSPLGGALVEIDIPLAD